MRLVANWKMNMGLQEAYNFLSTFNKLIDLKQDREDFIFFPPVCLSALFQKEKFYWGGQNIYQKTKGAFTGETSASTLKEMGASFCLLGHSERRYIFGESDTEIEQKFHLLQDTGLIPVLCVGENLSERFDKKQALSKQLSWIKKYEKSQNLPWKPELLPKFFQKTAFVVAYEPLWAIGSDKIPSVSEIEETLALIKELVFFPGVSLFYGGSVNKENVKELNKVENLDALLVGGASLNPKDFNEMYLSLNS